MTDTPETIEQPVILPDTTTTKVEFSEAQQQVFDAALKRAMGRAASDSRAEAADLKAKVVSLETQLKATRPDASQSDVLRAELEASKAQIASLQAAGAESAKLTELQKLAVAENFIDVSLITTILAPRVQRQGNTYIVVNEDGTVRTNSAGENLSLAEAVAQEAANRPYLVRGQVKTGGGGSSSIGTGRLPSTDRYAVESLWGPGARPDAGRVLNEWSLRDRRAYDLARKSAVAK